MRQSECVAFLQWALPQIGMRWGGFRRVRSQVCKRVGRRIHELGLDGFVAYRCYLEGQPAEWDRLDAMCRITISRFFRDRTVFEALADDVLPALASAAEQRGDSSLSVWSCGCASGEEAYTIAMLWRARLAARFPGLVPSIAATDTDSGLLERAMRGVYGASSVREVPADLLRIGFDSTGDLYRVRGSIRERVVWLCQDVRSLVPEGPFDLVLCRNLVLTYFDDEWQHEVMDRMLATLRPGGALVVGSHERLPELDVPLERWRAHLPIYRRVD